MKSNQYIRQAQYKKGFANVVLIGAIVLLVFVGGYFALRGKVGSTPRPTTPPPAATQTPTPTPADATADWKTYRNEQYGFEFKYPSQFYVYSEGPGTGESSNILFSVSLDDLKFKNTERMRAFTVVSVHTDSSIESFLSKRINGMTAEKLNIVKQEKVSDNPGVYKIYYSNDFVNGPSGVIIKNNQIIYITPGSGPTVDQILSTFKFL